MAATIVYGSDGGATRSVATRIARRLGGKALDIKTAKPSDLESCSLLILGVPTYGDGILQTDWEENIETLKSANLANKRVALFGTGDQESYPDSFVDAMGILYDHVVEQGAKVVGETETAGYDYLSSFAERDGKFVGLALDEDTQSSLTGKRIAAWVAQLT